MYVGNPILAMCQVEHAMCQEWLHPCGTGFHTGYGKQLCYVLEMPEFDSHSQVCGPATIYLSRQIMLVWHF